MTFWPFHSAPMLSCRDWPGFLLLMFQCYLLPSLQERLLGQISKLDPCMCIIFVQPARPPTNPCAGDGFSCPHMKSAATGPRPGWIWSVSKASREVWLWHAVCCSSNWDHAVEKLQLFLCRGTLLQLNLFSPALSCMVVTVVSRPGRVLQATFVQCWALASNCWRWDDFTFVAWIICSTKIDNWFHVCYKPALASDLAQAVILLLFREQNQLVFPLPFFVLSSVCGMPPIQLCEHTLSKQWFFLESAPWLTADFLMSLI